jgi:regulator of replication initiation timing
MSTHLFENIESLVSSLKVKVLDLKMELNHFKNEHEVLKIERERCEKRLQELTTLLELFQDEESYEPVAFSEEII